MKLNSYRKRLKEHDIHQLLNKQPQNNTSRIIIGYGQVGEQLIDDIFKRANNNPLRPIDTHWDEPKRIIPDVFVIEKNEFKVPHVIDNYNTVAKIGYIDSKDTNKEYDPSFIIPVIIGDARNRSVLELLKAQHAKTITFCTLSFRSNLSIIDLLINQAHSNSRNTAEPKIILACRSHAERETYQSKFTQCYSPHSHEVIQISEYIGTKLALMIQHKLAYLNTITTRPTRQNKILIIGNNFLYSTVESLYTHSLLQNMDSNLVIMDPHVTGEQFYTPDSCELRSSELYSHIRDIMPEFVRSGKLSIWKPTFCEAISASYYWKRQLYTNEQVELPVIRESPQNFMVPFMESWEPDLVVILHRRREDTEKILNLLFCHHRWNKMDAPSSPGYEIIVSTGGVETQAETINYLNDNFDIPYGTYSPTITISRELTLLEKMS